MANQRYPQDEDYRRQGWRDENRRMWRGYDEEMDQRGVYGRERSQFDQDEMGQSGQSWRRPWDNDQRQAFSDRERRAGGLGGGGYGRGIDYSDRDHQGYGYRGTDEDHMRRDEMQYGRGMQSGNWRGSQPDYSRNVGYASDFAGVGNREQDWRGGRDMRSGAGYGEDGRAMMGEHRGKGPKNYKRSDDRIREDVSDRLADDSMLDASNIDVAVQGGEVTLSGTVGNRWDKRRAEDLAESCSGVGNVQNNLRVQQEGAGQQSSPSQPGMSSQARHH